jgi:hypothetical protein
MSRFTDAKWVGTGETVRGRPEVSLTTPLAYEIGYLGSGWVIKAEAGFRTDLASFPAWAMRIGWVRRLAERFALASVVHDKARSDKRLSKLFGDYLFFESSGALSIGLGWRIVAFIAVLLNFSRH